MQTQLPVKTENGGYVVFRGTTEATTNALHRPLYHHWFMSMALRLNFQLDPRSNLAVRKSNEHTKHRLVSLIQKCIRYYTS